MKKLVFLMLLIMALSIPAVSTADTAVYITGYTTGKVVAYEAGKTISIKDDEGVEHSYKIMEDLKVPKGLKEGIVVEISASGLAAVAIEILEE